VNYRVCKRCGDAFYPDRDWHRLCWGCWRREHPRRPAGAVLDAATLRQAIALTHPDRHPPERHEEATLVTQALLAARQEIER
jgi:hypothetical protein